MEGNLGNEKSFLAPLSIAKIPDIGKQAVILLLKMSVERVKVIKLGKNGSELWRYANGIEGIMVIPFYEQKSISMKTLWTRHYEFYAHLHLRHGLFLRFNPATLLAALW